MAFTTPDWVKDAVFYQIFPDRFASSNKVAKKGLHLEEWNDPPTVHGFKGGDLLGIYEHLDYLQDLGINALYLNPITASASNHRYHTYDYFQIDPILGGDKAFRVLLDSAHSRGIHIIIDGVFNHASRGFWQFHHVLENGADSPYVEWFHFNPDHLNGRKTWGAYPSIEFQNQLKSGISSYEVFGYQAWWNLPALPKFNTNTPSVREFIFNAAVHWIKFGADGWRLDVPTEIDDDNFWKEFRNRVKNVDTEAYIVGEIWHESNRWLQGDQFDGVMNYLLAGALMGWLIGDRLPPYIFNIGDFRQYLRPINAEGFADRIDYLLNLYDQQINFSMLNLLDSHDIPRFITTANNDFSSLKLGWLFLFTFIGAPCLYYGDEIGLAGGPDPGCRGSFCWDKQFWNRDVYGYARSLIEMRNNHPALCRGTYHRLYAQGNVYAFARCLKEETIVIAFNAGTATENAAIPLLSNKTVRSINKIIGEENANIHEGRILEMKLAPRSGTVFELS